MIAHYRTREHNAAEVRALLARHNCTNAAEAGCIQPQTVQGHPLGMAEVALLVITMLVGAGMGLWRAWTVRMWCQDGQVLRQGTAVIAAAHTSAPRRAGVKAHYPGPRTFRMSRIRSRAANSTR